MFSMAGLDKGRRQTQDISTLHRRRQICKDRSGKMVRGTYAPQPPTTAAPCMQPIAELDSQACCLELRACSLASERRNEGDGEKGQLHGDGGEWVVSRV